MKNAINAPRPNLLFIMTDQQFGDLIGGLRRTPDPLGFSTPNLVRLLENGRFFDRAYATQPLCVPCRNSMSTGRYPHETGVTSNRYPGGAGMLRIFRPMDRGETVLPGRVLGESARYLRLCTNRGGAGQSVTEWGYWPGPRKTLWNFLNCGPIMPGPRMIPPCWRRSKTIRL